MEQERIADLANIFLALSDRTRLRLMGLMRGGEVSVGFLADSLGESQPKTSRHLAYLRNAGLVSTRRDGKWVYYSIERPADVSMDNVLTATLRSLGMSESGHRSDGDDHSSDGSIISSGNILPQTYMSEVEDGELPVWLL